ncbi:MAG TPA: dNTP triphosphohydrolase [Planctomycetes bacterium]|nr:dNTP triphosphohydrolase [Planctomycetota bacterium]HIJ70102.1 dNTP triphosphohydrolase [Planctomycetota bacterium]
MIDELVCYAVTEAESRQRRFGEKPHPYRTAFERDRDRIMHSSAFRRLEGKTQVFMPGVNDHYRTRLTHSIEVAQIGRTIAGVMNLNESLTEAICLAHDLGHSPFGHTGEQVLNDLTASVGGFEHNRQAIRIVDLLEHPYPEFAGLNLMYETRLGIARHHGPYDSPEVDEFEEVHCSLEGQIADISDRIAYNCHDLEDGLRAGLINEAQLKNVKLFADAQAKIGAPAITDGAVRNTRTAKTIIDMLVSDCLQASKKAVGQADIRSVKDVYKAGDKLIRLSSVAGADLACLEEFLFKNMYMHKSLQSINKEVGKWMTGVFEKFCAEPDLMPAYFQKLVSSEGLKRTVCDYIAGMTDWYCLSMLEEI